MHNIKDIRNQKDLFIKKLKDRNFALSIDDLLSLDAKNRQLIQEKESFEQEKKLFQKKKTQVILNYQRNYLKKFKNWKINKKKF